MADMLRFTAWMSEVERKELERLAQEKHCSMNLLVRTAIRNYINIMNTSPKQPKTPEQERA